MKAHKITPRLLVLLAAILFAQHADAQGFVLPGVGTVNRSMGGAAVAAPLDAAGAIHWNPATITGLPSSEFVVSCELLALDAQTSSTLGPLSGTTSSDSGVFPLPAVAIAFQPEDSSWSYGLGLYSIGGFGFNFPASDPTAPGFNPIFTPQPPLGAGAGAVYSRLSLMQLAPTIAVQLTDKISIGVAPTVSMADAALDPAALAWTDNADGIFPPTVPSATHGRIFWGLGFQAGIYYESDSCYTLGASFKSPQWFEDFHFNSADELGRPRTIGLDADYPMIISVGGAFHGIPGLVCAVDVRYVDYSNTDAFGDDTGFEIAAPNARVTGLGWRSVIAVATGLQYELTDRLTLRLGYSYNENPIRDSDTFFNLASPAIYEHIASVGGSLWLTDRTKLSFAYLHAFENSISGPINLAGVGPVPGTDIATNVSVDALVAGLEVRF